MMSGQLRTGSERMVIESRQTSARLRGGTLRDDEHFIKFSYQLGNESFNFKLNFHRQLAGG